MQVGAILGGIERWGGLLRPSGDLEAGSNARTTGSVPQAAAIDGITGCETCKNRRYQDSSDDPSVSFQTPQSIAPGAEYTAVRSHEQQHVVNEQARARKEGREVVAQSVAIHYAVCPECGRVYVAGGTTTTTTRGAREPQSPYEAVDASRQMTGQLVDRLV